VIYFEEMKVAGWLLSHHSTFPSLSLFQTTTTTTSTNNFMRAKMSGPDPQSPAEAQLEQIDNEISSLEKTIKECNIKKISQEITSKFETQKQDRDKTVSNIRKARPQTALNR